MIPSLNKGKKKENKGKNVAVSPSESDNNAHNKNRK